MKCWKRWKPPCGFYHVSDAYDRGHPEFKKYSSIEGLNAHIRSCRNCPLHLTRTQAVCGEGNIQARLMLIGQAPGYGEDREGKIFTGEAGKVLDELLAAAGIRREEIYLTNLLKCLLPQNRRPRQDEIRACSSHLKQEIRLVQPGVIVPLGFYASHYILQLIGLPAPKSSSDYREVFGTMLMGGGYKIFPLPHPASVLYEPGFKMGVRESYLGLKSLFFDG